MPQARRAAPALQHPETRHVFVYGTLRNGGRNDINRLRPAPYLVGTAQVQGLLYSLGWYPGLVWGGEAAVTVVGEVYEISAALEAVLDGIEEVVPGADSEYVKRDRMIEVAGRPLLCLVYEINPRRIRGLAPLPQGDWMLFHPAS